ncbi:MAG: leucine-rich repeat domain-containing protein [Oscillospiraceae bacterium]|nr:leucine-rich repeat domain-containing protein [Oscillospiraceae bacterium]
MRNKKILSLVLAIVMVFTLSTIILATGVEEIDGIIEENYVVDEIMIDEDVATDSGLTESPSLIEIESDMEYIEINAYSSYIGRLFPTLFPDRRLAQEIAREIARIFGGNPNDYTREVTQSQLNEIESLYIVGGSPLINSLEGMQRLENIASFTATNQNISSITPLLRLPLISINLSGNRIAGMDALLVSPRLEKLDLSNNNIVNIISPLNLHLLPRLTHLKSLSLNGNRISNSFPLFQFSWLEHLDISNNMISGFDWLSNFTNLERLGLSNSGISNVEALSGLTNLRELDLRNNRISDISVLPNVPWQMLLLCYNQINDISSLSNYLILDSFAAANQEVTQRVYFSNNFAAQNIVRNINGSFIEPYRSSHPHHYNQATGRITWNVPPNTHNITYSWSYDFGHPSNRFSGTVTVLIEDFSLEPSYDLFVRDDIGIQNDQQIVPGRNGLNWFGQNNWQLAIGQVAHAVVVDGAYHESYIRFDLPEDPVERDAIITSIMNATGRDDNRVIFNLFVAQLQGIAPTREIDLHLLPAYRVGRIHTNYTSRMSAPGTWMSFYDAHNARITARRDFRYYETQPTAVSQRIIEFGPFPNVNFNRYVSFDLTSALQEYFRENPNAESFGFVLSILRGNGLVVAHSSRGDNPPHIIIPANGQQRIVPTEDIFPDYDLFVRHDRGSWQQTRPNFRWDGGYRWHGFENSQLQMGEVNGAYRETLVRFDNLTDKQIDAIINANGEGNDRAVFGLYVDYIFRGGQALRTRQIALYLLPPDKFESINTNYAPWQIQNPNASNWSFERTTSSRDYWMSFLDAFDAQICVRNSLRNNNNIPIVLSEIIYMDYLGTTPGSVGHANTAVNRFVEFDLTDVLRDYFENNPGVNGFGFVLAPAQGGNNLIGARSTRPRNNPYSPRLTVPVNESNQNFVDTWYKYIGVSADDIVNVPILVRNARNLRNVDFSVVFDPNDFELVDAHKNAEDVQNVRIHNDRVIFQSRRTISAGQTWSGTVNTVRLRAIRSGRLNVQMIVER